MEETRLSVVKYPQEAHQTTPPPVVAPKTSSFGVVNKDDIFLNPEGGLLLYFPGEKYPIKGLREGNDLIAAESVKKYLKGWLSFFSTPPWKWAERWLTDFGSFCESQMGNYWLKEKWYSPPVQEIRRALLATFDLPNDDNPYPKEYWKIKIKRMIETAARIFESDPPYRWYLQDILQLWDYKEIEKSPRQAILKLFDTFAIRHTARNWNSIRFIVGIILLLPAVRKYIRIFSKNFHSQKMWFDEADLHYCLRNGDEAKKGYDFLGLSYPQRVELWNKIQNGTI